MLVIAAGTITVILVLPQINQIISGVLSLASSSGVQNGYMSSLLKVAGISLLVEFAAQTCRDANEEGLAMRVELAGRVMLIAMALPVMQALLSQIMSLSS